VTARNGWANLRQALRRLSADQLLVIVKDLHDLSQPNREFLQARLRGGASTIEEYRRRVVDAVFPDPFSRRPVRLAEAAAAVRQYERATADAEGTVDLLLSLLEAGTEQAVDLGYGDERYFGSLLGSAERIIAILPELPVAAGMRARARLLTVAQRAAGSGYGFGDGLAEIAGRSRAARART
jgi:hypothetical protein